MPKLIRRFFFLDLLNTRLKCIIKLFPRGIKKLKEGVMMGNKEQSNYSEILQKLRIAQESLDQVMAIAQAQEPPIPCDNDNALRAKGQPVKVVYKGVDYLYPSIREAARYNNVSESSIRHSLKQKDSYQTKGRTFSYYNPVTLKLP